MKTRKKKIILAIAIFLFCFILRETVFDFFYITSEDYNFITNRDSHIRIHTIRSAIQFTDSFLKFKANRSWITTDSLTRLDVISECNFDAKPANIPIHIIYEDKNYGDTSQCSCLTVRITKLDMPYMWVPLYKSGGFRCNASCEGDVKLTHYENFYPIDKFYHFSGNIDITGFMTIAGFSSYRHGKKVFMDKITSTIYKSMKEYLAGL